MIIAIEGIILCLIFTLMVWLIGEALALVICAAAGLVVQYVL